VGPVKWVWGTAEDDGVGCRWGQRRPGGEGGSVGMEYAIALADGVKPVYLEGSLVV
jgi:hypothetical protein